MSHEHIGSSIALHIEEQFPDLYHENGPRFVAFVKAYYEWLGKDDVVWEDESDVDKSSIEFIEYLKKTYLADFPFIGGTSTPFLVKHIFDYFSSRGTEESVKLMMMLMFGEEASIYYPSNDILKPSASEWVHPVYIEVDSLVSNRDLVNRQISGAQTRSSAIVEAVITKAHKGKMIDIIYLSSVKGHFRTGEKVTADGRINEGPTIIGSLSSIVPINGGRGFKIGDILEIQDDQGLGGVVRVDSTIDATGRADFELIDQGSGYTLTPTTEVMVSDATLFGNNPNLSFIDLEEVEQNIERLRIISADELAGVMEVGSSFTGVDANGASLAVGFVSNITDNEDGSFMINLLPSNGTFKMQRRFNLSPAVPIGFGPGQVVESASRVSIRYDSLTGSIGAYAKQSRETIVRSSSGTAVLSGTGNYNAREMVSQFNTSGQVIMTGVVAYQDINTIFISTIQFFNGQTEVALDRPLVGTVSTTSRPITTFTPTQTTMYNNYAEGVVASSNATHVELFPAFGSFEAGNRIRFSSSEASTTEIGSSTSIEVDVIDQGAVGTVSTKNSNTVVNIVMEKGDIFNGDVIKDTKMKNKATVTSKLDIGATDLWYQANSTMNAVITSVENITARGRLIGQNTTAIGIHGNTHPFVSSDDMNISSTERAISGVVSLINNRIQVITDGNHGFSVGDSVSVQINLQTIQEAAEIRGIFNVSEVRTTSSIVISVSPDQHNLIQSMVGLFPSKVFQTRLVTVKTDRSKMHSPPRDSSNNIIEQVFITYRQDAGQSAGFVVGSLENEETVFLETDMLGGENIAGVPYMSIRLDGAYSEVGFVDSIIVTNGGSGYANGSIVTFTAGGVSGATPTVSASGVIRTNGSGAIRYIQIENHGTGYVSTPTIVLPATSGTNAVVDVSMDYGYGFPKDPGGDSGTAMINLLTREPFTIGSIASLANINPGSGYTASPFVKIFNPYIAGFERTDFIITVQDRVGSFRSGEYIHELIGDESYLKGQVLFDGGADVIIRRIGFNTAFTPNATIKGQVTQSTAVVSQVYEVQDTHVMGDNAYVKSDVVSANGVVASFEVVDSGWGYEAGSEVRLMNDSTPYIVTGRVVNSKQGVGAGYWQSDESLLNGSAKIQDSDYYQDYSYEIVSPIAFEKYRKVLKGILHVAGTKMFNRFEKVDTEEFNTTGDTEVVVS